MQVLMEFVSSSAGDLSAWLGMDLAFFEAIPFLLLKLNACKVLIIASLLPHSSLRWRKGDFINELCTFECGFGFQWNPKCFWVISGEESIFILCKMEVFISILELFEEKKSINILKSSEMALTRISKIWKNKKNFSGWKKLKSYKILFLLSDLVLLFL